MGNRCARLVDYGTLVQIDDGSEPSIERFTIGCAAQQTQQDRLIICWIRGIMYGIVYASQCMGTSLNVCVGVYRVVETSLEDVLALTRKALTQTPL